MHGIRSCPSALTSREILSHVPVRGIGHKEFWDWRLYLLRSAEREHNKSLCLDLMDFQMMPNKCEMTSVHKDVTPSFVVEVPNDGFIWKEVGRQMELTSENVAQFEIRNCKEAFRILRVRDIGGPYIEFA